MLFVYWLNICHLYIDTNAVKHVATRYVALLHVSVQYYSGLYSLSPSLSCSLFRSHSLYMCQFLSVTSTKRAWIILRCRCRLFVFAFDLFCCGSFAVLQSKWNVTKPNDGFSGILSACDFYSLVVSFQQFSVGSCFLSKWSSSSYKIICSAK